MVAYLLNAAQKTVYISRGTGEKFNCNDSLPKDMVKGKFTQLLFSFLFVDFLYLRTSRLTN